MFTADAHCDTLYEMAICHTPPEGCAVTREKLAAGGVGLQTFALFAGRRGVKGTPRQDGLDMLSAVGRLGVPILAGVLPETPPEGPSGILSCEGGEMFEGSIERFHEFMALGRLRMVALTWNYENEIGHPAAEGSRQGLKPFGRALLREMDAAGVLADASHLNAAGFWDLIEHAALPPIASHSNCRWLCDVPWNLTREQVRAIIDRGGFIGINFNSRFLRQDGPTSLDDVVRHIDAICEMGGEKALGFGSDFDGIELWPRGLASPADFPALLEALRRRGYSESTLADIAGLNLWRAVRAADSCRAQATGRGRP